MNLHKNIKEERIQEICDKYIAESINKKIPITNEDVSSLSCAELVVLYYNTEWMVERAGKAGVETGLENQLLLSDVIKERVENGELYVIHTDATNKPFITEESTALVYTEKRFADMIACSFNVDYFREGVRFEAVRVFEKKEKYFGFLYAEGISAIMVDGTKFTIRTKNLIGKKIDCENAELGRILIRYAQAMRLGISKDKISAFQNAILSKLKENPKVFEGRVVVNDENEFLQIHLNAFDDEKASGLTCQKFGKCLKSIFNNKKMAGMVFNPEHEHVFIPKEKLLEIHTHLNVEEKTKAEKQLVNEQLKNTMMSCNRCGSMCEITKLDLNGHCPTCAKKGIPKKEKRIFIEDHDPARWVKCSKCRVAWPPVKINLAGMCPNCVRKAQQGKSFGFEHKKSTQKVTNTVNSINPNRPSIYNRPEIVKRKKKERDKAFWCLVWSLIPLGGIAPCMSMSMGIKAIKEAKENQEAVSVKAWIGMGISTIQLLFILIEFITMIII